MDKTAFDVALERAAAESAKQADEILDKVSALITGVVADLRSLGETKFRRDVIKLALEAAQRSQVALLTAMDAAQACSYTLAVADKLAPLKPPPSQPATPDTLLGYKLTDEEAAQVLAASK